MNPHLSGGFMCVFQFPGLFWGKKWREMFALIAEDKLKVVALVVILSIVVGATTLMSAWYGWRKPKE